MSAETSAEGVARVAVRQLLAYLGENPKRDGLVDTPARVVRALREMTEGYRIDPEAVLGTTFDVPFDEMVLVRGIPFTSLCEHHMLPFVGHATVAYVPRDRVVGLSKIARLVDVYARRLQVQERLTRQIADTMSRVLNPVGVAVLVESSHQCMEARGVKKHAPMVTSCLLGCFHDEPAARAEFFSLARTR